MAIPRENEPDFLAEAAVVFAAPPAPKPATRKKVSAPMPIKPSVKPFDQEEVLRKNVAA